WMHSRVAEYCQPFSQIGNRDLGIACQRIFLLHTHNQWVARNLLHYPFLAVNRHRKQSSIECSFLKPVKQMHWVTARQMNQAIREHPSIGIAKELKQVWINEGGEAESEGGHLSPVNRTRHRNDFGSFEECFLGVRDDHLPWRRDPHALAGSDEDRESEFVLEILDLFAEGRLCEKESLRGARDGGRLRHCDDVLQMPELHEI